MAKSKYPDPDDINLPLPDDSDPVSDYTYGYIVQHNRLWASFIASMLLNILFMVAVVLLLKRGQPPISYLTLQGGLPVARMADGELSIGGKEYSPARLTGVVKDYLEARFNYDWQHLPEINRALTYLTEAEAAKERARLTQNFLQSKIIGPQVKTRLELDYQNMEVVAVKPGEFDVTVKGKLLYNDLTTYPDPQKPQERQVQFKLRVTTVAPTAQNRDGYVITIIPEEIL